MTSGRPSHSFSLAHELSCRRSVTECLYVVVDNVAFATIDNANNPVVSTPTTDDFHAKLRFTCDDFTQSNLRTHLIHSNCSTLSTKFISVFEDEGAALAAHPFCTSGSSSHEPTSYHATKLVVDTSRLQAGWIDTPSGRLPVWLEHRDLQMVPQGVRYMTAGAIGSFDASIWICIDEVRDIFNLKPNEGEKGEWLACGLIPRSMVTAQVVLHNYQRRPDLAHPVPNESGASNRSGSIRSISSKEQDMHIKMQILRNKASREDLRAKAAFKKPSHGREWPLLRQAVENRRLERDERSEVVERPLDARAPKFEPRQQAKSLSKDSTKFLGTSSRYSSVRSPKLHEALERLQESRSAERLEKIGHGQIQGPQELITKHTCPTPPHTSETFDNGSPGENSLARRKDAAVVHLYEQALHERSNFSSVSEKFEEASIRTELDKDSNSFSHTERIRRARVYRKRHGFFAYGHKPRLDADATEAATPKPKEEPEHILDYALDVVSSVLDEIVQHRVKFALPEPPLSQAKLNRPQAMRLP